MYQEPPAVHGPLTPSLNGECHELIAVGHSRSGHAEAIHANHGNAIAYPEKPVCQRQIEDALPVVLKSDVNRLILHRARAVNHLEPRSSKANPTLSRRLFIVNIDLLHSVGQREHGEPPIATEKFDGGE